MNFRVIPLGKYPDRLLAHIKAAGCFIRLETTDVRGEFAFVGAGRVWAVGILRDVKEATQGKAKHKGDEPPPQGYLWCFDNIRDVEGVECAKYPAPAMFMNGDNLEPQALQAGAQVVLLRYLESLPDEWPESAQIEPLVVPDEDLPFVAPYGPEIAFVANERGQVELF